MRRIALSRVAAPWGIALLLVMGWSAPARAQDDKVREEIVRLGQVSGDDALKGQLVELLQDKKRADNLLTAAVKLAKTNDPILNYPAALTLAQIAQLRKDVAGCEALYRVCMKQAVKLQSSNKILESYGGLIDVLYENKKYGPAATVCQELLELETGDGKPRIYMLEQSFGDDDFFYVKDPNFNLTRKFQVDVHRLMIMAIAKDGRHAEALKLVDNLVRLKDHWRERQLRGFVLREAGKLAEAAKVYEDVLERIEKDDGLTEAGKDFYGEGHI